MKIVRVTGGGWYPNGTIGVAVNESGDNYRVIATRGGYTYDFWIKVKNLEIIDEGFGKDPRNLVEVREVESKFV